MSGAGRPWTDPLNAFASGYSYNKRSLPVLDRLAERTSLLSIPPVLSDEAIERIGAEFVHCASDVACRR
ncbi:MAG TPA: hypothetical protein VN428_25815 [Bryobacteraceae bacterium]|nr:hypothetical protein [Bryobacteraceae bacterium]